MAEAGAGSTEIVRGDDTKATVRSHFADDIPDHFRGESTIPDLASFPDSAKEDPPCRSAELIQSSTADLTNLEPARPHVPALADEAGIWTGFTEEMIALHSGISRVVEAERATVPEVTETLIHASMRP